MPINAANLKWYLSGGGTNSDPNASLGGAISSTEVSSGSLNNLFDNVTATEATTGDVEYRCVYFKNLDTNESGLMNGVIYMASNTPSPSTTIEIGVTVSKNSAAQLIADESTAPSGISFSAPTSPASGIPLPGVPLIENDYCAIWVRRTVSAGAGSLSSDPATLRVQGDTA